MEEYDYEAAASTVNIDDITTDEINRKILRQLKENDPTFDNLFLLNVDDREGRRDKQICYSPEGARDIGWLGYFLGKKSLLCELSLRSNPFRGLNNDAIELFYRGMNRNRSIQKLFFDSIDLSGGEIFQSLLPFFKGNHNLSEITVVLCQFRDGCARRISLALRSCSKSLKSIGFAVNQLGDELLVEIIEALVVHPQLERLDLQIINVGRSECSALGSLLRCTFTDLRVLNLSQNAIDDEGVDALVDALMDGLTICTLGTLNLSSNPNITARGYQRLASLLEYPHSNLRQLFFKGNDVGDEGAFIFAKALAVNRKLKTLNLYNNGITAEGWFHFSKVLCNTSTINNTFLSNHTLESLGYMTGMRPVGMPVDVKTTLVMNSSSVDKSAVAIKKILMYHRHFDMHPFFELDLKVLPIVINWFERARSIESNTVGIGKLQLASIYQFIRAMPEIFEPAPAAGDKRKRGAVNGIYELRYYWIVISI